MRGPDRTDHTMHASSALLYPIAMASPAITSLRDYFERTYRQSLAHVDDSRLVRRALHVQWYYHDQAPIDFFNLSCTVYANIWRRAMCRLPHLTNIVMLMSPTYVMRKMNWFGSWRPKQMPGVCGSSFEPAFLADHAWVEVLRLGPDFQEGGLYGCWYLAAKGSGIFLNTGRSLRATNRSVLANKLGLNLTTKGRKFLAWNPWRLEHNTRLCEHAVQHGYDTLQLGWEGCGVAKSAPRASEACFHEIISCHPQCLALPTPCQPPRQHSSACAAVFCPNCCRTCSVEERETYRVWNATHWPQGPCIHSSMLRTGWNASLPCKCDNSRRVLNWCVLARAWS